MNHRHPISSSAGSTARALHYPAGIGRAHTVLIAIADSGMRAKLVEHMQGAAMLVEAATGAEALERLQRHGARIALLDRHFPDLNSEELVGVVERQFPGTEVVLVDGASGRMDIPEEMRDDAAFRGLSELFVPPRDDGAASAWRAKSSPAPEAELDNNSLPGMVAASECMRAVARLVRSVAPHNTAVLVTGETGVGKELVAEAIHRLSPRAEKPFITVNCAAIPEALVEAELFGHTRGAFTGAVQSRLGKIHAAQQGTVFFDEIGELPLASQAKLLRFLESGEVQRLGTSDVFRLDVRVVAATNVDLERKVKLGLFREDLYYRLSVFPIELPPLRERVEDIPMVAEHFLRRLSGGNGLRLTTAAESRLMQHTWPGNVRELRNVVERAFVLSGGRQAIGPELIHLRKPCGSVRVSESS